MRKYEKLLKIRDFRFISCTEIKKFQNEKVMPFPSLFLIHLSNQVYKIQNRVSVISIVFDISNDERFPASIKCLIN